MKIIRDTFRNFWNALKSLFNWLRRKKSKLLFKPIDATRHLNSDELEILLEINRVRKLYFKKPLMPEVTLQETANDRAFFFAERGAIGLDENGNHIGWSPVAKKLLDLGVGYPKENLGQNYKEQDGTVDGFKIVQAWMNKITDGELKHRRILLSNSKYIGIGVAYKHRDIFVSTIYGK